MSQVVIVGLVQSEGKRQLGHQWTHGKKPVQNDHSKIIVVIGRPMEGELLKLPPFQLWSNDPKTNEPITGVGIAFGNISNQDATPFEMLLSQWNMLFLVWGFILMFMLVMTYIHQVYQILCFGLLYFRLVHGCRMYHLF